MSSDSTNIESILREDRKFESQADFAAKARISSMEEYKRLYKESISDPETFWNRQAEKEIDWFSKWTQVLNWKAPFAEWFVGATLNVSHNCLDRHVNNGKGDKPALIWEGEPGDVRTFTYSELLSEVERFAAGLKRLGVAQGDRVAIYMPLVPEAAVAMLACARVGATHNVVFGGFSSEALKDRINDSQCKVVITADGGFRRGAVIPLKNNVDEALKNCPSVSKCVVLKRTSNDITWVEGRDVWYSDVAASGGENCPAIPIDSEHPLYILYTSGTTGKPKGVIHSTGGYLLGCHMTCKYVFDLREDDVYWCTADIGWVTGHSYVVYGPLSCGATVFMFEGAPNHPEPDRFWELIDKHKVSIFYTAPTAIRAFIKWGTQWVTKHKLDSLRLLGTVGEPINPEAWIWYRDVIGHGKCPIVDTWWQTETGTIMITPLPGVTPTKPGSATLPFFGVEPDVVDHDGNSLPANTGGLLVIRKPWPSMLRGIYGDPERFKKQYFEQFPGIYFTGDGARRDSDGYFWVMGRVDDVINVSGHRLGTMEVESALVSHPKVAESAVVGRPHDLKGEAISAFVTLESGFEASDELREELRLHVGKEIGSLAKPDDIRFTESLPKTRSGKIMRRLLRDIAAGKETLGDTTTLEDYSVLAKLREENE
jgi:acetyl-CoA synthetase